MSIPVAKSPVRPHHNSFEFGGWSLFFRKKRSGERLYVQLVANQWRAGRVQQRLLASLGQLDQLIATGDLERLLDSGLRLLDPLPALQTPSSPDSGNPCAVIEAMWVEADCDRTLAELSSDLKGEAQRVALQCAVRLTVELPIAPFNPALANLFLVDGLPRGELDVVLPALERIGAAARTRGMVRLTYERRTPGPRALAHADGPRLDTHQTLYVVHEAWPDRLQARGSGFFAGLVVDRFGCPDRLLIAESDSTDALKDLIERASRDAPIRVLVRVTDPKTSEQRLAMLLAAGLPYVAVVEEAPRRLLESTPLTATLRFIRSASIGEAEARQYAFHLVAGELGWPPAVWIDELPDMALSGLSNAFEWADIVWGDLVCRFLHLTTAIEYQHRLFALHRRRFSPVELRVEAQLPRSESWAIAKTTASSASGATGPSAGEPGPVEEA